MEEGALSGLSLKQRNILHSWINLELEINQNPHTMFPYPHSSGAFARRVVNVVLNLVHYIRIITRNKFVLSVLYLEDKQAKST